jgi:OOP family OmpA-OmpF porin
MKKLLMGAAALLVLPSIANAQDAFSSSFTPTPGMYVGVESGLSWLLNNGNLQSQTGYAVGGKVGYDFVGPRLELETLYRNNTASRFINNGATYATGQVNQVSVMTNALYDFIPGARFTPYAGAGIGVAFVDPYVVSGCSLCSTQFAYQAIGGVAYNATPNTRISLEARYYGTTNAPSYVNNDVSVLLGVSYKFGATR